MRREKQAGSQLGAGCQAWGGVSPGETKGSHHIGLSGWLLPKQPLLPVQPCPLGMRRHRSREHSLSGWKVAEAGGSGGTGRSPGRLAHPGRG